MRSRLGIPDTQADLDVKGCLDREPPRSFVMVAGAGSGKTTSLIKAMAHLADKRGRLLCSAGQKIACITYTEVAAGEIKADVGPSSLFHISTIHSFLWSVIKPFQSDIRAWVIVRIGEKIAERRAHWEKPRIQARTKARLELEIAELEAELQSISHVKTFTYGFGSSYSEGILGHDDILRLTPACIGLHPLLRNIVAKAFPYIFIDESQDTNPDVTQALLDIARDNPALCIGFFGDPMQRIYMSGAGDIPVNDDWLAITKRENFRCSTSVLNLINAVRASGDGLVQNRGRMILNDGVEESVEGTANLFILPNNVDRSSCLNAVRNWLAAETRDEMWLSDLREGDVRLLVLVHRMAANRLGFPNLYSALHDRASLSLSEGLSDGTAWPIRSVIQHILPLVMAARENDDFSIISILRRESPKLESARLQGQIVAAVLAELAQALEQLKQMFAENSQSTVKDVMLLLKDTELLRIDDRFGVHLVAEPVDDESIDFNNVQAYLACGIEELLAYRRYIDEESPFATHHGVKGAQFERVLVVIDDEEAGFGQYSYGKYFKYVPLSENDEAKLANNEETVVDRTRRLFYVCCSRSMKDLAVVIFAPDVDACRTAILEQTLFAQDSIRGVEHLQ